MGGGGDKSQHFMCHLTASAMAAVVNFPLWKASAIGQSGFDKVLTTEGGAVPVTFLQRYAAALRPPYKGVTATIGGMTWARAFIFYGSDWGKLYLERRGVESKTICVALPPLLCSSTVQLVNQPIIRASITLQNPQCEHSTVPQALRHLYKTRGLSGLWHGTSAGVMKTVPKYCVAVAVKDYMEGVLDPPNPELGSWGAAWRSAKKSVAAGVAGAALTNPVDVLRNEMFKTDLGVRQALSKLIHEEGAQWATRGMTKNLVAVSIPIGLTIFFTDVLIRAQDGVALAKTEGNTRA
ncbi:mitochondrial carrier domain-containing protein [Tribonema minus]|uniref:Mitochondrial carrier domain-containing protein n=1 Tax=Tribonema minus TaxID=303371 RepID=A0A835YRL8_9STRA|nr:mitochondrial carrier domain-containing protein [Tribonema minus]